MTKAGRLAISEAQKKRWAAKKEQERLTAENDLVNNMLPHSQDSKKRTSETKFELAGTVIQVYASEGNITRFILNDAGRNSFEMAIEGE
jgi:hypothetical protein